MTQMIAILVIAVLGGMRHPIGAFIGAVVYVMLQNFAIDLFVPRALQPRHRRRVPRHRPVFPRRFARAVGEASLPAWFKPPQISHQEEEPTVESNEEDSGFARPSVRPRPRP